MIKFTNLVGAAAALLLASSSLPTFAATPLTGAAPGRIVLSVDRIDEVRNLPVLVAEQLGYFKDEGLIVTLMEQREDVSIDQLMKDGRIDGAVSFYHHTFMSQVAGNPTESVVTMGVTPALTLMISSRLKGQVKTLADLKGKRIYTGGLNSGKTTTANWLMASGGNKITDYTALKPVAREQMAEALRDGTADAIVAHEPDASYYQASGAAFTLADITSAEGTRKNLGTLFPTTALQLPDSFVAAHPATVQHLVNACLKALAFIRSHSAEQILAVLPAEVAGKDRQTYLLVLASDKRMFYTDGLTPDRDARRELEIMAGLQPQYRPVVFRDTFTNAFVRRAVATSR